MHCFFERTGRSMIFDISSQTTALPLAALPIDKNHVNYTNSGLDLLWSSAFIGSLSSYFVLIDSTPSTMATFQPSIFVYDTKPAFSPTLASTLNSNSPSSSLIKSIQGIGLVEITENSIQLYRPQEGTKLQLPWKLEARVDIPLENTTLLAPPVFSPNDREIAIIALDDTNPTQLFLLGSNNSLVPLIECINNTFFPVFQILESNDNVSINTLGTFVFPSELAFFFQQTLNLGPMFVGSFGISNQFIENGQSAWYLQQNTRLCPYFNQITSPPPGELDLLSLFFDLTRIMLPRPFSSLVLHLSDFQRSVSLAVVSSLQVNGRICLDYQTHPLQCKRFFPLSLLTRDTSPSSSKPSKTAVLLGIP